MPRPKEGYRCADGVKVNGATDPIGRYGNKEPLIPWARKQGFEQALRGLPKPDHFDRSDLDIGTVVHDMAEQHLRGQDATTIAACAANKLKDPRHLATASHSFEAFKAWAASVQLEVVALEPSLVSERYRYGGTLDIVARVTVRLRGKVRRLLVIIDIKPSRSGNVYAEHLLQLAAYRQLWEENGGQKIQGFFVVVCPKDGSPAKPFFYEQLREQFRLFLLYRDAYDIDKAISAPAALAGVPIAPPPAARPPKPKRDVLNLNGRARHARFLQERAKLNPSIFTTYDLRISANFQPAAGSHPVAGALPGGPTTDRTAGPGAARAIPLEPPEAKPVAAPNQQLPPQGAVKIHGADGSGGEPGSAGKTLPGDLSIPEFLRRANGPNLKSDGWTSFNEASK